MEQQESDAPGLAWFLTLASIVCLGILGGSLSCEHHRPHPPTKGQGVGEANMPTVSIPLSGPAEQGRRLFDSIGCRNCHTVHGRGGTIGPDLSDEGARGRSPAWLRRQIRDPKANDPRSVMFPFDHLSDQQVNDLVAYIESLSLPRTKAAAPSAPGAPVSPGVKLGQQVFDSVGCLGCHRVNGRGGTLGPDLSNIANAGHSTEWLEVQIRDPKAHNRTTIMPAFTNLTDTQVQHVVEYLETLSTARQPPLPSEAGQGKQLFDKVGCLGCHAVNGQGGKVGPDLSNIANAGHSRQWLRTQIRDPKAHDPQTAMPAFNNLSDQQVNDLVDYLETLSTTSKAPPESGARRGRQLFDTIGCRECHTVDGKGGEVGPDLSNEGGKGRSPAWLETQIRNPRAHDPNTAMPAWDNLPSAQVNDLVDYLESLKGAPMP